MGAMPASLKLAGFLIPRNDGDHPGREVGMVIYVGDV